MKNVNSPGYPKNGSSLAVSVTIDEATLLKSLVEKLCHRRYDTGYSNEVLPEGWKAMETSSIEAYVSGCLDIQGTDEYIALPYTTCFSFSCIKTRGSDNTLAWVNCLS